MAKKTHNKWWKLIPMLLILSFEILAIFMMVSAIKFYMIDWENDSFFGALLVSIVVSYVLSGIVILLVWALNFLTGFDDFDDFGEGIGSLRLAPFKLIQLAFGHIFFIFGYLHGCIFGVKSTPAYHSYQSYQNTEHQSNSPQRSYEKPASDEDTRERDTSFFSNAMEKEMNAIAGRGFDHYTNRSGANIDSTSFLNCTIFWGTITFTGTIHFKHLKNAPDVDTTNSLIKYYMDNEKNRIMRDAKQGVKKVVSTYKGFDKDWTIRVNLDYTLTPDD